MELRVYALSVIEICGFGGSKIWVLVVEIRAEVSLWLCGFHDTVETIDICGDGVVPWWLVVTSPAVVLAKVSGMLLFS